MRVSPFAWVGLPSLGKAEPYPITHPWVAMGRLLLHDTSLCGARCLLEGMRAAKDVYWEGCVLEDMGTRRAVRRKGWVFQGMFTGGDVYWVGRMLIRRLADYGCIIPGEQDVLFLVL